MDDTSRHSLHAPEVLVVIDLQVGVVAGAHDERRILGVMARLVDAWRSRREPIIWVRHEDEVLVRGSEPWQWAGGLAPQPPEPVVVKSHRDGFEKTALREQLSGLGARHLAIVGAQSEFCILTTALRAVIEGFDVTLVADAHTTTEPLQVRGALDARGIIEHTNDYFRGLRYPGREVAVVDSGSLFGRAAVQR